MHLAVGELLSALADSGDFGDASGGATGEEKAGSAMEEEKADALGLLAEKAADHSPHVRCATSLWLLVLAHRLPTMPHVRRHVVKLQVGDGSS
jgi:hypothetical protein